MSAIGLPTRIPQSELAEQWFSFLHGLIATLQKAYLKASREGTLNQKIIAKRLGKDPASISRCLSGQQNMTMRTMHDLARAMDCRLEISLKPLKDIAPSNRPRSEKGPKAGSSGTTVFLSVA